MMHWILPYRDPLALAVAPAPVPDMESHCTGDPKTCAYIEIPLVTSIGQDWRPVVYLRTPPFPYQS